MNYWIEKNVDGEIEVKETKTDIDHSNYTETLAKCESTEAALRIVAALHLVDALAGVKVGQ